MTPMWVVVSAQGAGGGIAGSAHGIFDTKAEALRYILAHGLRGVAWIEEC